MPDTPNEQFGWSMTNLRIGEDTFANPIDQNPISARRLMSLIPSASGTLVREKPWPSLMTQLVLPGTLQFAPFTFVSSSDFGYVFVSDSIISDPTMVVAEYLPFLPLYVRVTFPPYWPDSTGRARISIWDNTVQYSLGQLVIFGGARWESLVAFNVGIPGISPTWRPAQETHSVFGTGPDGYIWNLAEETIISDTGQMIARQLFWSDVVDGTLGVPYYPKSLSFGQQWTMNWANYKWSYNPGYAPPTTHTATGEFSNSISLTVNGDGTSIFEDNLYIGTDGTLHRNYTYSKGLGMTALVTLPA